MAKRHNHYEAAFEDRLRRGRTPYVAVDEQRRALADDGSLKSVDFVVSPGEPLPSWLVDVKGRRFPSGTAKPRYWRNWTTDEELASLERWAGRFGNGFVPVLVFAYELVGDRSPVPPEQTHAFRGRRYAFVVASATAYRAAARPLSPRWGTVAAPTALFRRIATPLDDALGPAASDELEAVATAPRGV